MAKAERICGDISSYNISLIPPVGNKISIVVSTQKDVNEDMFSCDLEEVLNDYIDFSLEIDPDEFITKLKDILERASKRCNKILKRKLGSPMEKLFWDTASCENLDCYIFGLIYQYQVKKYVLDFAYIDDIFKLAIEIDGHEYHKTKKQRTHDAKRARELTALGWDVIRFTGSEVYQNPIKCALQAKKIIYQKTGNALYRV